MSLLVNPDRGRQYFNDELRERLGLGRGKLGLGTKTGIVSIDGTEVYVLTAVEAMSWRHRTSKAGKRPHRVWAICHCGKHIPAGKFHQHLKAHPGLREQVLSEFRAYWNRVRSEGVL